MVTIKDLPQQHGGKGFEEIASENKNKALWSFCLLVGWLVCFPVKETAIDIDETVQSTVC